MTTVSLLAIIHVTDQLRANSLQTGQVCAVHPVSILRTNRR